MTSYRQLTTLALLKLRVAICKRLNAASYLGCVDSISFGHYYGKRPCQPYAALDQTTISRVHRSRSQNNDRGLWFGNETTCAHEYNILECKGQQPASAVNNFIDQGEFVAMKTLSGRIAPRCDKHQFCDKMTVST